MPGASAAREPASDINLYRIPGEDAPFWLAAGFAALGPLMALAAGYLLASPSALAPRNDSAPARTAHVARVPRQPPVRPAPASLEQAPPAARQGASETSPAQLPIREATCLPAISVAFSNNSAQPLLDGAQAQLEPLLKWLKDHGDATLLVEGHADPRGREAYNVMLSYSRAQAVIAWLAGLGIEKRRMTPLAAGAALPKNPSLVVADNRMALVQVAGIANCHAESAKRQ
ncbi:OmpA family protein [Methylocystis sp. B8]|uniref:OmpA family protein n=1 Tax=Methylocystis sp. B8 TaxID=544938 RepID=UPI0010FE1468|nr:OmpA family protein [Methylocystis sp. B8]TLG75073.1 OmpA family protein [Methylocystis sp. B8]